MRRDLVRWLLLPVLLAIGVAIGYLSVGASLPSAARPTATSAHDHGLTTQHHHGAGTAGAILGPVAPAPTHDMAGMSNADMAGMSNADMAGMSASAVPAAAPQLPAGTGGGADPTMRAGVVGVFVVANGAILAAAALLRRRAGRTHSARRPAVRAV